MTHIAAQRWDNALKHYTDSDWGAEELLAQTGMDNIADYFGTEEYYVISRIRAEKDVSLGTIVYNYSRDEYDVCFDCRFYENSGGRIALQDGDGFDVWINSDWVGTRIFYDRNGDFWYLSESYDVPLEEMRIRNYRRYSRSEEDSDAPTIDAHVVKSTIGAS
jgi:hypothetical protein